MESDKRGEPDITAKSDSWSVATTAPMTLKSDDIDLSNAHCAY